MQSKSPQPTGKSGQLDQAAGGFSNPESIGTVFTSIMDEYFRRMLQTPEAQAMIQAEVSRQIKPLPEYFTREEMAALWKVCPLTVSRMKDEQIEKHGFKKTKVNGNLRFVRI